MTTMNEALKAKYSGRVVRHGASIATLRLRVTFGGKKGRRAMRRLGRALFLFPQGGEW